MKRANFILTMTASALILFASQAISAAEAEAPAHALAASGPQKADTLVHSATKSIIESVSELSKTASKLSEAALKLMEAQQCADTITTGKRIIYKEDTDSITLIPATPHNQTISDQIVSDKDNVEEISDQTIIYLSPEEREGGKYLWISDSDLPAVESFLNGDTATLSKPEANLNEMAYWRGDSIPMAIPTKRLGRYDRKLYNWLIYPKGLWHLGLTANYGELSTKDNEFLSLIQDVDLKGKIYSIKPSVSYFLRNNLCVGVRLAFTKGEMGINSFKVDIDEDMSFDLHDIKYSSDSYSAAIFIQQYFGLSRRGRFAVFNEAELSIGTGNSHFIRPFDGKIRETRTKTQSFNINYSPGVSILMMKNAAFNLSFGIFGFHLKDEKQWENGEESGSRLTSGINFRFNLFNINFGVSIII